MKTTKEKLYTVLFVTLLVLALGGGVYALSTTDVGNLLVNGNATFMENVNVTGDLNMTSNNITSVDCILFNSGGKICSGT